MALGIYNHYENIRERLRNKVCDMSNPGLKSALDVGPIVNDIDVQYTMIGLILDINCNDTDFQCIIDPKLAKEFAYKILNELHE